MPELVLGHRYSALYIPESDLAVQDFLADLAALIETKAVVVSQVCEFPDKGPHNVKRNRSTYSRSSRGS